jgi:2-octaprenylphenol hydroxylase
MLALMDLFKRFFSNDNQPLAVLRNFGLNLVDAMGPLKRALVRRAMGMTGELPELAEHLPEDAFAGPGSSAASPGYPRR